MKKTIKILKLIKKIEPGFIFTSIINGIFKSLFPFVNIIFSYLLIDGLINNLDKNVLYNYVFIMVILNLIIKIIIDVTNYFTVIHKNNITFSLRFNLALKSYEIDYEQLEDKKIMSMIKKADEGSNSNGGLSSYIFILFENLLNYFLQIVYSIILLLGLFKKVDINTNNKIINFINNPLSSLIIFITILILLIFTSLISKKDNKLSYESMLGNIEGNRRFGYFYRICNNYKIGKDIRLYGMQNLLLNNMSDDRYSIDKVWGRYRDYSIKFQIFNNILNKLLLIISFAYVGLKAYYGLITIGKVVSYVNSILIIGVSLQKILSSIINLNTMNSYLDLYFDFLELKSNREYGDKNIDLNKINIEFKNVSFKYPNQEKYTLENINLKINNLDKVAIVGENGSGKTTLIKLLCRFYDPNEGNIFINNYDIKEYNKESIYKLITAVFQDYKLFSYSIKENIVFDKKEEDDKIYDILDKVGIKERIKSTTDGLNTIIYNQSKDQGIELSGGESQKIAIARALYKDSPLMILDEPTSSLDPKSEADIYNNLNDLTKNKTSIFISHRMSSCIFCDKIIVLDKGKIEEEGNHLYLLDNKKLYFQMWEAQSKYYN